MSKSKFPEVVRHGKNTSPIYNAWLAMKRRCFLKTSRSYKNYGARGITVCDRWMTFDNFYIDMRPRPDGTSLDRIDNDGNYEPSNCRWATMIEQNNNSRNNRFFEIQGRRLTIAQWAREVGVNPSSIVKRSVGRKLTVGLRMSVVENRMAVSMGVVYISAIIIYSTISTANAANVASMENSHSHQNPNTPNGWTSKQRTTVGQRGEQTSQ